MVFIKETLLQYFEKKLFSNNFFNMLSAVLYPHLVPIRLIIIILTLLFSFLKKYFAKSCAKIDYLPLDLAFWISKYINEYSNFKLATTNICIT